MKAASFLPHTKAMALVEEIESIDDESVTTSLSITENDPFFEHGTGVPTYVTIEYMAQSIAAWAGYHANQRGEPPAVGFLLGARKFEASDAVFAPGSRLTIRASVKTVGANGLSAFDCRATSDDGVEVSATVNVFQPKNLEEYLKSE